MLHTLSIKFCTSEWQGLKGANTSRTVPPITKISLRGLPLRGKKTYPCLQSEHWQHVTQEQNIICVETLLKFVLISFVDLALERCHVDSRSNCKRKLIPQGHNTIRKRSPVGFSFCNVWELTKGDPQMIWWWDGSGRFWRVELKTAKLLRLRSHNSNLHFKKKVRSKISRLKDKGKKFSIYLSAPCSLCQGKTVIQVPKLFEYREKRVIAEVFLFIHCLHFSFWSYICNENHLFCTYAA